MHNCQFWTFFLHLTSYLNHLSLLQDYFTLCACMYLYMAFTPACIQYFPLLLLVPFTPTCALLSPPPCTFTPTCGHISSLYILCQYLDQPLHYLKYLDQFLSVLLTTITTRLVFARQSKQGVITLTLYFDPNYTLS